MCVTSDICYVVTENIDVKMKHFRNSRVDTTKETGRRIGGDVRSLRFASSLRRAYTYVRSRVGCRRTFL